MVYQEEILKQIKALCTEFDYIPMFGWWHFTYGGYQMVYICGSDSDAIRICIPHYDKSNAYNPKVLSKAINETNRCIKYVKTVVLENGSITINYDHKCGDNNDMHLIVLHILKTLRFAADYLTKKLSEK